MITVNGFHSKSCERHKRLGDAATLEHSSTDGVW